MHKAVSPPLPRDHSLLPPVPIADIQRLQSPKIGQDGQMFRRAPAGNSACAATG